MPDGYDIDVFISYKRSSALREWIKKHFLFDFKFHLTRQMRWEPVIFLDERVIDPGNDARVLLEANLRDARCMVALLDLAYFRSPWCCGEWMTFRRRAEEAKFAAGFDIPTCWALGDPNIELDSRKFPPAAEVRNPVDLRRFGRMRLMAADRASLEEAIENLAIMVARRIDVVPANNRKWPAFPTSDPLENGQVWDATL